MATAAADIISRMSPALRDYLFPKGGTPVADDSVMFAEELACVRLIQDPDDDSQFLSEETQALIAELKALQDKYGVTVKEMADALGYTVKPGRLRIIMSPKFRTVG